MSSSVHYDLLDLIFPRGIRFNGSLPETQHLRDRQHKRILNLRTTTKRAIRRAVETVILHMAKDGSWHVHTRRRGLTGRQWKKYKRYRKQQGDPIT